MPQSVANLRWLCLALVAIWQSGCALTGGERNCCHCPQPAVGTVETGGPFAVSRVLPIPPTGLTLNDAVESSLRPGIANQTAAIRGNRTSTNLVSVKDAQDLNKLIISILTRGFDPGEDQESEIRDRTNEIVYALFGDGPQSDSTIAFSSVVEQEITKAAEAGAFAPRVASNVAQNAAIRNQKQQLYNQILLLHPPAEQISSVPPVAMIAPSMERSIADELAVVLQRPNGRRLIIPLQFVRTYRPGDIQLEPGDQIQIVPFPQMSTNSATPVDGDVVAVTSWYAKEGLAIPLVENAPTSLWDLINEIDNLNSDTVILRRLSAVQGLDEYILPSDDSAHLAKIPLENLDLVHLDAFGRNPLTRQGPLSSGKPHCAQCGLVMDVAKAWPRPIAGLDQQVKRYTGVGVRESAETGGSILHGMAEQGGNVLMNAATGVTSQFR